MKRIFSSSIPQVFCVLVLFCLVFPVCALAITIDEFVQEHEATANNSANPKSSVISDTLAIGGTRSITAIRTSPAPSLSIEIKSQSGFLSHSQDANVTGRSIVSWDGDSTADQNIFPSNPNGLQNLDLTQDNGTAFKFGVSFFDFPSLNNPLKITTYVYSNNLLTYSVASLSLASKITTDTELLLPFTNFAIGQSATAPADFKNVGAIVVVIDGLEPAIDLTLSYISTNGECPIIPINGNAKKDKCGVCGGNDDSCKDCEGIPNGPTLPGDPCDTGDVGVCKFGKYDGNCKCIPDEIPGTEDCTDTKDNDCNGQIDDAKVDKCGVCNGDGTSCFECEKLLTAELSTSLDHGAKQHERVIKDMIKVLLQKDQKAATAKYADKTLKTAHALQDRNWKLSWTLPSVIYNCSATTLCYTASNVAILDEYRAHSEELRVLAISVAVRLEKLKVNTKKFRQRNDTIHNANIKVSNEVPETTNVCVYYPGN